MPVGAVIIGGILGLSFFLIGLHQRRRLRASLAWPQTMGTITATSIEQRESRDSDGDTTYFTPNVVYTFVVNGSTYVGTRTGLVERSYASLQGAQVHLARYPIDARVPVYFDPEKPSNAVLTRTAPGASAFLWVGAAILTVVLVTAIKYSS